MIKKSKTLKSFLFKLYSPRFWVRITLITLITFLSFFNLSKLYQLYTFNLAQKDRQTQIYQQIQKWEKIAQDYPGYRDAFLKLASLYYQLNDAESAQHNLNQALILDPNNSTAKKLYEKLEIRN